MEFKDKFNRLLVERGLKKNELAKRTGASKGSLTQWSAGETRPGNKYLTSVARELKCDAAWLMDDSLGWEDRDAPESTGDSWDAIKSLLDDMPRRDALKLAAKLDLYIDELIDQSK